MFNTVKLISVVIFFLAINLFISCHIENHEVGCENIECTDMLKFLLVSVKDQDQNPIALDSFKVLFVHNKKDITLSLTENELELAQKSGNYPLIEDGVMDANQEKEIQFIGYLNNEKVINRIYTVKMDCCHVNLIKGDLEVIL